MGWSPRMIIKILKWMLKQPKPRKDVNFLQLIANTSKETRSESFGFFFDRTSGHIHNDPLRGVCGSGGSGGGGGSGDFWIFAYYITAGKTST